MDRFLAVLSLCSLSFLGCGDDDSGIADASDAAVLQTTFGGDRPVELRVPQAYDAEQTWPLLVFLHGYSSSAESMLRYSKMDRLVDEVGILLVAPNGLKDTVGLRFWNATDFCCDFSNRNVDDVGYLSGLIEEISAIYSVDPKRIYLWGHSNGGFMAHRMACEKPDILAAIISFAGATYFDESLCTPSEPLSVLQFQGTKDEVVAFEGDGENYPGAETAVARWADYNGCGDTKETVGAIDITPDVPGNETTQERFTGCPEGIEVGLWSASEATHFPAVTDSFRVVMWEWFAAHPKR